jgi:hypothetical protein
MQDGGFYWRTFPAALVCLVYLVYFISFVITLPAFASSLVPRTSILYPLALGLRSIRSQASL